MIVVRLSEIGATAEIAGIEHCLMLLPSSGPRAIAVAADADGMRLLEWKSFY